ncbi:AEC family transporter (plasmid) [Photobacterium sp. GJ3]|uniref:AEC family transporter n=1 Tax=Photobacterium sp. GJ3 TaxID=2829502 RepID=UPI001B8B33E3|nr:AEC family transporter [Photobacterium sp. GJ3]QUJ69716.1 AEC family transporter [Photobacterium sp. GJ3]
MGEFLTQLAFSFTVTGPIFIMLALGIALKKWGIINDAFTQSGSRLVFTVTLPTLLFLNLVDADIHQLGSGELFIFAAIANIAVFLLFEFLAGRMIKVSSERGVVVQGAFRANTGIIGLAYVANAYGNAGIVVGALYVAVITVLYNILAVITLSRSNAASASLDHRYVLKAILTNPLILSICSALPFTFLEIRLPDVLMQSGRYFADMTLPLALLCTGASLDFRQLRQESSHANLSTCARLIIAPVLITIAGYLYGFRDHTLGIIFLMSAAPTAAASYVMARAMGANASLAANIIAMTTLGSMLTCSLGLTLLKTLKII